MQCFAPSRLGQSTGLGFGGLGGINGSSIPLFSIGRKVGGKKKKHRRSKPMMFGGKGTFVNLADRTGGKIFTVPTAFKLAKDKTVNKDKSKQQPASPPVKEVEIPVEGIECEVLAGELARSVKISSSGDRREESLAAA